MVKQIKIVQYRKLREINIDFSKNVNIISGTNATCKSSILYLVSNSYKAIDINYERVNDNQCIKVINNLNYSVNPKIESLTKGDKQYNDPAKDIKGKLFSVEYFDGYAIDFRKHNSKMADKHRYAIKPTYKQSGTDKLPEMPVVYLGLPRLFPYGEFTKEKDVKKLRVHFPESYQQQINEIYKTLTNICINTPVYQAMGDVKRRADFVSQKEGVDSNTISAGEDNVYIIINALISLKYYFENLKEPNRNVESVLLIDEFDATLHPSMQYELLNIINEFSRLYKIQVILTTHSLSTIDYALREKDNIIYLIDNLDDVKVMSEPSTAQIEMHLKDLTKEDAFKRRKIPIFAEDEEARILIDILFDYYKEQDTEFRSVVSYFYCPKIKIGAENMRTMFEDSNLRDNFLNSICILDGDKSSDLGNNIISLPGNKSPENLVIDYAMEIFDTQSQFWSTQVLLDENMGKKHFALHIKPVIEANRNDIRQKKENGTTTHGLERKYNKETFNKHQQFFKYLLQFWVREPSNRKAVDEFFADLNKMYKKTAIMHGLSNRKWDINKTIGDK